MHRGSCLSCSSQRTKKNSKLRYSVDLKNHAFREKRTKLRQRFSITSYHKTRKEMNLIHKKKVILGVSIS